MGITDQEITFLKRYGPIVIPGVILLAIAVWLGALLRSAEYSSNCSMGIGSVHEAAPPRSQAGGNSAGGAHWCPPYSS